MSNSFIKKRLALFMAILLVFSSLPIISFSAASGLPITYTYNNPDRGTAGGTISFTPNFTGTVDLFWGVGGSKIEGYSEFGSVAVTSGTQAIFQVQGFTAIPDGATQVLGFNASTNVFEYDIPSSKQLDYGDAVFSFGALSDAHFGPRYNNNSSIPINAFNKAAGFFAGSGVELIAMSGDITAAGNQSDYVDYRNTMRTFNLSYPTIPVFTTSGNHDQENNGLTRWTQYTTEAFSNYTGRYTRVFRSGNSANMDYTVDVGSHDVFVFLHQKYWRVNDNTTPKPLRYSFDPEQLDWLVDTLDANEDKRVYLFIHEYIDNTCGDATNGYYAYNEEMGHLDAVKVLEILKGRDNVIEFSGHSHLRFELQFLRKIGTSYPNIINSDLNIYNGGGQYATMVHTPSVTSPRDIVGSNSSATDRHLEESQGYLVEVYDGFTILKGYDFIRDRYLAFANYIVDIDSPEYGETVDNVSLNITSASLQRNGALQLKATVLGDLLPAQRTVTWESNGGSNVTVSPTGLVTVAANADFGEYLITAKSTVDPTKSATATITVVSESAIIGSGTKADPYIISNEAQFAQFTDNMKSSAEFYRNKHIRQTADLDMTKIPSYAGISAASYFKGYYDGQGHVINVDIISTTDVSVFPRLSDDTNGSVGVVMNLGTTGRITGGITGSSGWAAGIARSMQTAGSLIINCWSTTELKAWSVGGITISIRNLSNGGVRNCLFAGELSGTSTTGSNVTGAIGPVQEAAATCFYYLAQAPERTNGATSLTLSQLTTTAADSLNAGRLSSSSSTALSAVGGGYTTADLVEWTQDYDTGYPVHLSNIVVGITVSESTAELAQGGTLQLNATVLGNLADALKTVTWESDGGANVTVSPDGLVTVAVNAAGGSYTITARSIADSTKFAETVITVVVDDTITGSGTKADPFVISNEAQFLEFTNNMIKDANFYRGKYIIQTANIDMDGVAGYNGIWAGTSLNPDNKFFNGYYNGLGHTINVNINSGKDVSIFPRLGSTDQEGVLMNIGITGTITGNHFAAGLVRSMTANNFARIINCWSTANVRANYIDTTDGGVGGITVTKRGVIENCLFAGSLAAPSRTAGITSNESAASVNSPSCYYLNTVTANYYNGAVSQTLAQLTTVTAASLNSGRAAAGTLFTAASGFTAADLVEWVQDYDTGYPVFVDGIVRDVTISPLNTMLPKSSTVQLTASVIGNLSSTLKAVTWSSDGGANVTVGENGLVSIAANAPVGNYTITAASVTDPTKTAEATIQVATGIITSGLVISNVGDAYTASVKVNNYSEATAAGILLIISAYDATGKLIEAAQYNAPVNVGLEESFSAALNLTGKDTSYVKAYLWNNYVPIEASVIKNV